MVNLIRGKVARILDTRHLALNIGSSSGVRLGMYFDVLDPKGEDILDPDTGEVLGSVDRPKVRIIITKVEERLAVGATFRKKEINIGGKGTLAVGGLAEMFMPPKYITRFESLKTVEKTWEDLDENESYVKTGDPVIQVVGEGDVDNPGGVGAF